MDTSRTTGCVGVLDYWLVGGSVFVVVVVVVIMDVAPAAATFVN